MVIIVVLLVLGFFAGIVALCEKLAEEDEYWHQETMKTLHERVDRIFDYPNK